MPKKKGGAGKKKPTPRPDKVVWKTATITGTRKPPKSVATPKPKAAPKTKASRSSGEVARKKSRGSGPSSPSPVNAAVDKLIYGLPLPSMAPMPSPQKKMMESLVKTKVTKTRKTKRK